MQEEVEQKVVSLIVDCGKLGEQELKKALAKLVEQMKATAEDHHRTRGVLFRREKQSPL